MKTFLHQACVLGGFYFIISKILGRIPCVITSWVEWIMVFMLIVALMVLVYQKSFPVIKGFVQKYPKISNYVTALGVVAYFSFFFGFIPGAIDGYFAARAEINKTLYVSQFVTYLPIFTTLYWVVFWASIIMATYLSFVRNLIYKSGNK